jgi:hypothetical protein
MRIFTSFAIVFCLSAAAAAQQPGSAGAARPKLQVLQALPESQLFPLMNLISESLGVRCDFCHVQAKPDFTKTPTNLGGWVWDSDDKPAKRIARDMMRMTIDLNARSFGGRSRVTCVTCHQGALDPRRTPPLPPAAGIPRTPAAPPLPPIDRVWANYVNAVGKIDTPAPGTGMLTTGWDDRSEGRYGKIEIIVAGGDRYRATLTTAEGTTIQGLDGETAWVSANGRLQRLTSPADVERVRRIAMRSRPLKERSANLQVVGLERIGERDTFVARGRVDATTVRTLYFDVVTGLLRREMTTTDTMLLPLQEQVDYEDYRDVGGMQMPFRVQFSDGAPYGTVTRTFVEIRRNVPVEDATFRPPAPR